MILTIAKVNILDLYNLNDIEASEQKTWVEVLLLYDRFICREDKADICLNFQLTFIHIYATIDIFISILAFDFCFPLFKVLFSWNSLLLPAQLLQTIAIRY